MPSTALLQKMNAQIEVEMFSSNLYLQMSAWADVNGYHGIASFLKEHSKEELSHAYKFFDFIRENDTLAIIPALEQPKHEYVDIFTLFDEILAHEKFVTSKVMELATLAHDEKDFYSFGFLQYFINEQHEEEALFSGIIEKMKMIGGDGRGQYLFDKEIGKIQH